MRILRIRIRIPNTGLINSLPYLRSEVKVWILILDMALLLAEDLLARVDRLVGEAEGGKAGALGQRAAARRQSGHAGPTRQSNKVIQE